MAQNPLETLTARAFGSNRPLHASMELTYSCNLHCLYCYNPVERRGQTEGPRRPSDERPLEFEEMLRVLDQLRTMGVLYLTLTGGEPMLHPRFWDIAFEARARAFALRIFTNGSLIGESEADRFAELCPQCLEISIHGASAAVAEALDQVPGAHEKVVRALGLLSERGIRVFLKCVVTCLNEGELPALRALGDRFDYPVYFDPVLSPSDDGLAYPLRLQASEEGLRRLYGAPELRVGSSPFERSPGQPACGVASGTLHLDPYGNMMPCVQWRERLGNVRERTISEIWEGNPSLIAIRKMSGEVGEALRGASEDHPFCQHCPGLSRHRYGDALRPDDQHLRVARIRREVWERAGTPPENARTPKKA